MRIDTDLSKGDRKKVKEYAKRRGLVMSRAYTELIKKGLEYEKN